MNSRGCERFLFILAAKEESLLWEVYNTIVGIFSSSTIEDSFLISGKDNLEECLRIIYGCADLTGRECADKVQYATELFKDNCCYFATISCFDLHDLFSGSHAESSSIRKTKVSLREQYPSCLVHTTDSTDESKKLGLNLKAFLGQLPAKGEHV